MRKKLFSIFIAITMFMGLFVFAACDNDGGGGGSQTGGVPVNAGNLMERVVARSVTAPTLSNQFINSTATFSIDLFRETLLEDENTFISAVSVLIALAMTANGARGNTLSQMEQLLGGGITIAQLNRYIYAFANSLYNGKNSEFNIANSIWFRDHLLYVEPDFLQVNADYFAANAYAAPFDNNTVEDINNWVNYHTDGMIEEILEEIPANAVMYLINALMFDARWQNVFGLENIHNRQFAAQNGTVQTVPFMTSGCNARSERYFIQDEFATGFIKPYYGGHYSFVALLPNEGVCVLDYVATMTGTGFVNTMRNAQETSVFASFPKFEFDFTQSLIEPLEALGMTDAFCMAGADFRNMAQSPNGNIFVSAIEHSTFISVNELGTRAGAVTMVEMGEDSGPWFEHYVILDRPFVFAIIDNATSLPIFMGTVLEI